MDSHTQATELEAQPSASQRLLDEIIHSRPVQWVNDNRALSGAIGVTVAAGLVGVASLKSLGRTIKEIKASDEAGARVTENAVAHVPESAAAALMGNGLAHSNAAAERVLGNSILRTPKPESVHAPDSHMPLLAVNSAGNSTFDFRFAHDGSFDFARHPSPFEAMTGYHGRGLGYASADLHDFETPSAAGEAEYEQMLRTMNAALIEDDGLNIAYGRAAHEAMPDLEPLRQGVTKESWDAALGLDTSHWQAMIADGAKHQARSAPAGVTKERQKLLDLMGERSVPQEMIGVRYTGVPLPTDFDQMDHMRKGSMIPQLAISRPDLTHAVVTDGTKEEFGAGIWSYHNNAFAAHHNARLTGGKVVALHYVDGSPKVDRGVRVQMNISMGLPLDHGVRNVRMEAETNVFPLNPPHPEST